MNEDQPQILVPWPVSWGQEAPAVAVFDGDHELRATDLSKVELYVMPYAKPDAQQLISKLPALRALQVLTAGYDSVLDLVPAGVELHNGTGLHDASTAEHALALILAAQREFPRWFADQQAGVWAPEHTGSLADSRVLIVGYGNIGQAIERRLLPFETTVTRVARRARPEESVHPIEDLPSCCPRPTW